MCSDIANSLQVISGPIFSQHTACTEKGLASHRSMYSFIRSEILNEERKQVVFEDNPLKMNQILIIGFLCMPQNMGGGDL